HLGPHNALRAHQLLGGGVFLPIHWGTFSLAMHAWDQPAEVLYEAARAGSLPLLMPRLGEAVEPAHAGTATAWWRGVGGAPAPAPLEEPQALPRELGWPLD
ncbi:MAG TPA: hypothetical protein VL994_08685, partial [Steroidobacteraceae bacterium]|nr:hypothetical protein [Steroidobacteraceae bacterium]